MNIEKLIKNKKLKRTSARVSLLEIFQKADRPLSYEDIKESISMDKATFYRNIAKFEEAGVVNAFESNDKKRYFELKLHAHAHFVCLVCGKIECIRDLNIDLPMYEVNNVILSGRCKSCLALEY